MKVSSAQDETFGIGPRAALLATASIPVETESLHRRTRCLGHPSGEAHTGADGESSGLQSEPARHYQVTHRAKVIAVDSMGPEDGAPVILLHGMPGSRTGPHPLARSLYRRRVRLIAYDRPGYGASSACPGRPVVDAASDIEAIADTVGIDRFAVVGRSGGGPYALAAAARLPDRVTAAAVLVGFAPPSAPGLGWFEGMHQHNTEIFRLVERPEELQRCLAEATDQIRRDPQEFLERLRVGLRGTDRRVIEDVPVREQLKTMYAEAFPSCGNSQGWIDDVVALRADWGFDPAEIRVPTYLWHGTEDVFAPIDHTRWLASRIPSSTLCTGVGVGHFGALEALPEALSWLAEHHLRATG